jgi:hypothetical protein
MGLPEYFAIAVMYHFGEAFSERWIGVGDLFPAALDWPSRNPDLSVCDSSIWGYIEETLTLQLLRENDDLKEAARLPLIASSLKRFRKWPMEYRGELFLVMILKKQERIQWTIRACVIYGRVL